MKRDERWFVSLLCAAILSVGLVGLGHAEILSTGVNTEIEPGPVIVESPFEGGCSILWFRHFSGEDSERERLMEFGYDVTLTDREESLVIDNLMNYGILVIAYTPPGALTAQHGDILAYVSQGGGVLIHQPNATGIVDYAPPGFDVEILNPFWCQVGGEFSEIVDGSHPITSGLANADLSGAFDDVGALGSGYSVLAKSTLCDVPSLAVGTSGLGRVAFDTGNGSAQSASPGSEQYWDQLFGWLCTAGPISVKPSTWGSTKAAYRGGASR